MRILEIGEYQLMREAYPATTDHWSTTRPEYFQQGDRNRRVGFATLPRLARDLAGADYDLVLVQPATFAPWQWQAISRSFFQRQVLRGSMPYARHFGQQMLRGRVVPPVAVWDWDEPPFILRQNAFLLDAATLYFKRELPPDHWRVFMGSIYGKVPTSRFRLQSRRQQQVAKLRPISLGLPIGREKLAAATPVPDSEKTADVFFTGRVEGSTSVRQRGLQELLALRDKGFRVDIPDNNLPLDDYLKRCARAWLTWSPEGYGYECFRTYEAAVCGSVPVMNRSTVDGYKPLRHGEHCFYYDVEPGGLTRTLHWPIGRCCRAWRKPRAISSSPSIRTRRWGATWRRRRSLRL